MQAISFYPALLEANDCQGPFFRPSGGLLGQKNPQDHLKLRAETQFSLLIKLLSPSPTAVTETDFLHDLLPLG